MEKEENINTPDNEIKKSQEKKDTSVDDDNTSKKEKNEEDQPAEKTLEEKVTELEDKLARTFAEMENQRRRFEKEKEEAFEYGGFAFAKEALNLIDNLERSKQILKNDETIKDSEALKKTLEHLEIIGKDLISIFSKNNINPIESLNKKLDPNLHQAMMEIEDDQKEPGIIIQEIQKGFTIKDRLLRPSLVGVSKKTTNNDKKDEKKKGNIDRNNY
tara:strand:- start:2155 stop:2802 length:648 start_codon:yes stop_codon:yes gene_type:complete